MPRQMIDPQESGLAAEWLLIMERLKVADLAAWIAQFRRGDRASNPDWRSWEAIARRVYEDARVTVSANGLRAKWSDDVDALLRHEADRQLPDVPASDHAVGSTGPAGSLGSELPAGSNPAEGTR